MRLRITFAKTGSLRFIGHLDLHQVWERTARRAGLPLAYTQGFHPGPRLQVACALPLGFAGSQELMDLWLKETPGSATGTEGVLSDVDCQDLQKRLQASAPPGLQILHLDQVADHLPALQNLVEAADYVLTLAPASPHLEVEVERVLAAEVARLLAAETLPRQRRGKEYDLRPLILSLEARPPGLWMTLAARPGATGRPEEVLEVLGIPRQQAGVERTRLLFKDRLETAIIPEGD
jgi:radical SAM-linked protein